MNKTIKRLAATGVVAVTLPAGLLATTATSASAQAGMHVKNSATNLCLEANLYNNVFGNECNGGFDQSWQVDLPGTLRNEGNNNCLEGTPYGFVFTATCDDTNPYQVWRPFGPALQNFRTGLCLQVDNNGNVSTRPCYPFNPYQEWEIG